MKRSKRVWIGIIIAAAVLGSALGLFWRRTPEALAVGNRAPEFTLENVSSGSTTFNDRGHHVTLVNFWATWCPPCVMEAPSLEQFATEMKPLGVRVVGVSVDQNDSALRKFIAANGITYTILRDPNQALMHRFGTFKIPETYIFDRDGRLADKIIGATDWTDPQMIAFVKALVHWPPPAGAVSKPAPIGRW